MRYEFTDIITEYLNKQFIAEFNNFKSLLKVDEINALSEQTVLIRVRDLYDKLDKMSRDAFLTLAKQIYKENTNKFYDLIEMEIELWLDMYLNQPNSITKYIYTNEVDRKRARFYEAIMSQNSRDDAVDEEVKTTLRGWTKMIFQYLLKE